MCRAENGFPYDWRVETPEEAMHANFMRALVRVGSLTAHSAAERNGGWLLIDAGLVPERFNLAVRTDPAHDPAAALNLVSNWYAARGGTFRLVIREPADADLAAVARRVGFSVADREPSMLLETLPAEDEMPTGFRVRVAETAEEVDAYGRVDALALHEVTVGIARTVRGFPDFAMLLGELDGAPIATSMAVVTGDLVGVYNVHVRPEARSKGLGRAITAAAIEVGRQRGARQASLQATEMGERLYHSMGFRTVYDYLELTQGG